MPLSYTGVSYDVFMPVIILMGLTALVFFASLLISRILRPFKPTKLKATPYECGEEPVGSAWTSFNIRFYVVGLIFIIFDVESVLLFPVAVIFKKFNQLGMGAVILVIFLLFVSVLVEGVIYCWKKGDLDWVRSFQK